MNYVLFIELEKADFGKVRPLFTELKYQLATFGVIDGIGPGQIHVDNPSNPTCALMLTSEGWFIAGDSQNSGFKNGLSKYVERMIVEDDIPFFSGTEFWFGATAEWIEVLEEVFPFRVPQPCHRIHYVCNDFNYDWRRNLPSGFEIREITREVIENPSIDVPDHIRRNISGNWGSGCS